MAFVTLASTQLFAALGFRSSYDSIVKIKPGRHPALWLAFFGSLLLQLSVVFIPPFRSLFGLSLLEYSSWLIILALSLLMLGIIEVKKFILRLRNK